MIRTLAFGTVLFAGNAALHAQPLQVRVTDRPTSGHIVIDFAQKTRIAIHQHGNHVELDVGKDIVIATPERVPRNVVTFVGGSGRARLDISAGSRLRPVQHGKRLTLEIDDVKFRRRIHDGTTVGRPNPAWKAPPSPTIDPKPSASSPSPSPASSPSPSPASSRSRSPAEPDPPQAATQPLQAGRIEDKQAQLPQFEPIELPARPETGAVAFRRGDLGIVVFDGQLDTSGVEQNTDSKRVSVAHLPNGTMLSIKLAPDEDLVVDHRTYGWQVSIGHVGPHPATQAASPLGPTFEFGRAGRAMSLSDPLTGQTLLLGTLPQTSGDRLMIAERRMAPGYVLLPTWLGLAVVVSSDAVDLRPTATGFALQVPDRAAPGAAIAAARENGLGIPLDDTAVLRHRLSAEIASAAAAPPRGRGQLRLVAARAMLALGLDVEAEALLKLAANDDPAIASDPAAAELTAAAAILGGRPEDATGLDSPSLPASGDVAMWRGLRNAALGEHAPNLGANWPRLATYPPRIADRIGPTVIEAAVMEGAAVPTSLLQGPRYGFARALQKQTSGDIEGALKEFGELADSRDERNSVRATVAAAELRLSKNMLSAAQAADKIDAETVRWRGDREEMGLRLRVAELRQEAAQWRAALAELQQVKNLFPESSDNVSKRQASLFQALLEADPASIQPLELVTIAGEYASSFQVGPEGDRLAGLLADKLVALDLPSRAKPLLEQLMAKTESPSARAEFGLRLAQVELDAGDPNRAEQILAQIDDTLLPAAKAAQRTMLLARARAERGDNSGAATLLSNDDRSSAEEARADYLAKAGDWNGSLQILNLLLSGTIPAAGPLSEHQQDLVLRAATAAVHSEDTSAIDRLRSYQSRMQGPRADLFRVLVQPSVATSEDLPRAARELSMARMIPARLNALNEQ